MAARVGQVSFAYDPLGRLYQTDATVSGGAVTNHGLQFCPKDAPA
jgi:hypothetical protein